MNEVVLEFGKAREGSHEEGCFACRVLDSPAGSSRWQDFTLPWTLEQQAQEMQRLGELVRAGRGDGTARELGERLFRLVMEGVVAQSFWRSWGLRPQEAGLRLRLRMAPGEPGIERLLSLPWELLCLEDETGYLSLSARSPIVRSLDVSTPSIRRNRLPKDARLLLGISLSEDIDGSRERETLEALFGDRLRVLEGLTLRSLRTTIESYRPHVVHLIGHGWSREAGGEGFVELVDDEGKSQAVSGQRLAEILGDSCPTPGWAVLSSCSSARTSTLGGADPLASTATALVRRGLEVVAMQFPISDRAAACFADGFYTALSRGETWECAASKGRQRIRDERGLEGTLEWATPVVFQRAPASDSRAYRFLRKIALIVLGSILGVTLLWGLVHLGKRAWAEHLVDVGLSLHRQAGQVTTESSERVGKLSEARAVLHRAVELAASSARAHANLAQVLWESGRYHEAVRHAEAAVQIEPNNPTYRFKLGAFYRFLERFEDARLQLDRAAVLCDPSVSRVDGEDRKRQGKIQNELGLISFVLQRYGEARSHFELGLAATPDLPQLYKNLALTFVELDEPSLAVANFEEALERYDRREITGTCEAALGLAKVHALQGDRRETCTALAWCRRRDPQWVSTWGREARSLWQQEGCSS